MHHLAKITFGKVENLPYHAECACGTAGDFAGKVEASNYVANHLTRLQGINSAEFVDETATPMPVPQPEPEPEVIPPEEEKPAEEEPDEEAPKKDKKAKSA
jgi:outer membrane biosynthesis protein TonB